MSRCPDRLPRSPGTYALLLAPRSPCTLRVGRLGSRTFDAPFYLYAGSALGSGGLAARLAHHLRPVDRPHWHIDALRRVAPIVSFWTTIDARRLECAWSAAASELTGARPVPGFGASDCDCNSHLVALPEWPTPRRFRRSLTRRTLLQTEPCPPIHVFTPARHARERRVRSHDA